MNPDAAAIALALERAFQQPVPLTLGRLRDLLGELAALDPDRRGSLVEIGRLLDRYDLAVLPLTSVAVLIGAVDGLGRSDDVAARFTPRELEDLLSQVQ